MADVYVKLEFKNGDLKPYCLVKFVYIRLFTLIYI